MPTARPSNDALAARNAAMRDRVDTMIEQLQRRTGELAAAQAEAVTVVGEATSKNGAVTVRTNAAGVATAVVLADDAFARTTPAALAALVLATTQEAARDARGRSRALLGEFTTAGGFLGGSVDPAEVVPGLHVVTPGIPEAGSSAAGDDWDPDVSVLRGDR